MAQWRYKTKKMTVKFPKYTKDYTVFFRNDEHQKNWTETMEYIGGEIVKEVTLKEE
tara:strand:+ start:333 stop:500 length:168 start_codon:yes stop_codon:yes gene_type:complete